MFSRSLRRAVAQLSSPTTTTLPPTFLLPLRAHLTTTTITTTTTTTTTDPNPSNTLPSHHPPTNTIPISSSPPPPPPTPHPHSNQNHPQLSTSSPLPPPTHANLTLLPLLAAQPPHYILTHIHSRPYLLTHGDTLRLPFHLPSAPPGTILRLNRASTIGSRDYTYRGTPWVDERCFVLRAVVVAVEGEPLRVVLKTKRRNRRVRSVMSKGRYTVLRVMELRVLPEGRGEGGEEVVDADGEGVEGERWG